MPDIFFCDPTVYFPGFTESGKEQFHPIRSKDGSRTCHHPRHLYGFRNDMRLVSRVYLCRNKQDKDTETIAKIKGRRRELENQRTSKGREPQEPENTRTRKQENQRTREQQEPENQRTREPENQRTREPENHKNQRIREPENQKTREPENQRATRTRESENQRTRKPENQRTREPENQSVVSRTGR